VAGVLSRAFPARMSASPELEKMVAAGRLGRKNGIGFYRYAGKKRIPDPALRRMLGLTRQRKPQTLDAISERLVLVMVNEAARCLEEGVVSDAGKLDLAMIFGAGFPPFRGGLLRHADAFGLARAEQRLIALRAEKGDRFEPAALLSKLVAQGKTFTTMAGA
jgi:3-hydroxyacyl-CoA dehydrogenase/enoyl-CoA hydratase/3-hydroxybutyryl-CoA epimerase